MYGLVDRRDQDTEMLPAATGYRHGGCTMSRSPFPHVGHQAAENWVRQIIHGVVNFQEVSEKHLPIRDPLRTVVGRGESGFAEVFQHVLEDFADIGDPDNRFGWIYAYGMDLKDTLRFVDDSATMRLPRYRSQATEQATPESGRNDVGAVHVAQDVSRAYIVLENTAPPPQSVPAPNAPPTTGDREIGASYLNQGQEDWRKWTYDQYIGNRVTLQDAELVIRSEQETSHPASLISRDERTGGNTVNGGGGLLGPTVGMGMFGTAEPFVRTSDRHFRAGEILLSATRDGRILWGTIDGQVDGYDDLWDQAATTVHKHYEGADTVDWDAVMADGEIAIDGSGRTAALEVSLPSGVTEIDGRSRHSLDAYIDVKARLSVQNIHGGLVVIQLAGAISSGSPLNVTVGTGKVVLVVNAGTDLVGTVTVTGTSVDRNTGAETGSDTDDLVIAAVTTDGTATDANGVEKVDFTGAYMTSKWFTGAISLSTSDVDISDVDVYQIAFEQCNDVSSVWVDTLDVSALATNSAAWLSCYLYSVAPTTGDLVDVAPEASIVLEAADVTADRPYRLRRGVLDKFLDGTTSGFFVQLALGPLANTYWEDASVKVWLESAQ